MEAGSKQRISARVLFVLDPGHAERPEHAFQEVAVDISAIQFAAQEFTENLEVTGSVNEDRAERSNRGHDQSHHVPIRDAIAVETRGAFNAVGEIQKLPDGNLIFA